MTNEMKAIEPNFYVVLFVFQSFERRNLTFYFLIVNSTILDMKKIK